MTWNRALLAAITVTLVFVIVVAVGGALYESAEARADVKRYPPPGKLVLADGLRLHLYCTGNIGAHPTIVFEAGKGGFSLAWATVQDALSAETRVCSYDRAGYGWSEGGAVPHDAAHTVQRLHAALQGGGEHAPYLMVAHSLGGLYVRLYATEFPQEVAGMVLLDPTHEEQATRLPPSYLQQRRDRSPGALAKPMLATLGYYRLRQSPQEIGFLPKRARAPFYSKTVIPEWFRVQWAEEDDWDATDRELRQTGRLGDIPLLVLTATRGEPPEFLETRRVLQAQIAGLSSRGEQRLVTGADHYSFFFEPSYTRMTIGAIGEIVAEVRQERPDDASRSSPAP